MDPPAAAGNFVGNDVIDPKAHPTASAIANAGIDTAGQIAGLFVGGKAAQDARLIDEARFRSAKDVTPPPAKPSSPAQPRIEPVMPRIEEPIQPQKTQSPIENALAEIERKTNVSADANAGAVATRNGGVESSKPVGSSGNGVLEPSGQGISTEIGESAASNVSARTGAAPDGTLTFQQPSEKRTEDWKQNARNHGVTDENVLNAIAPKEEGDAVTGFYLNTDKVPTVERAIKHVEETGQPAHFVEADISNLGGLNTHFNNNHELSNKVYRSISDIFKEEMDNAGSTAVKIRHGGDEFNAVIIGGNDASIRMAMENTQRRVAEMIKAQGLDTIPHPKHPDDLTRAGVGVYLGSSKIEPSKSLDEIFAQSSAELDQGKANGYVGRKQSREAQDSGTVQGQPAGVQGGNDSLRPAAASEARPVLQGNQAEQPRTTRKLAKKKPVVYTLLTVLRDKGVSHASKNDVVRDRFAPGGYNQVFRKDSRNTIESLVEDGALDDFLPHELRLETLNQPDAPMPDMRDAVDYIKEKIANGERVLPYNAERELEKSFEAEQESAQEFIDGFEEDISYDEANKLFQEAANEQRSADREAEIIDTGNADGSAIVGDGKQETKAPEANAVTEPVPKAQEREGVRPLVETIIKRHAAANQLGKEKPYTVALGLAKDLMNGKEVTPAKFKNAAAMFKGDKALSDAFTQLHELAKAPAKEAKAAQSNTVADYRKQISEATTEAELHGIAKRIQKDATLNDSQAELLDGLAMDAIDNLDGKNDSVAKQKDDGYSKTIDVDGKQRPTVNSNGNPIHITKEGVRNFWKWFGDSKVVDGQGRPLVVYHGSPDADFVEFKDEQFFSPDPSYASRYTNTNASSISSSAKSGNSPAVIPVYLKIENPFDPRGEIDKDIWNKEYFMKYGNGTPLQNGLPDWTEARDLAEFLREERNGDTHDGLILDEGGDESGKRPLSYLTFNSKQIKSATGNSGEFSPDDASIVKQSKGAHTGNYGISEEAYSRLPEPQQAAHDDAVASIVRLRRNSKSLLANRISDDLKETGAISLIGREINSPEDLAVAAQVYRNPKLETFRYFFEKDGVIVDQNSVTSRLPGVTATTVGDFDSYISMLNDQAKAQGATGFYILHNHPSGDPTPSDADIHITGNIARAMGIDFRGHVVINHDSYAVIKEDGVQVIQKEFKNTYSNKPSIPHVLLGKSINSAYALAEHAKAVQTSTSNVVIIGTSGQSGIGGITEVNPSMIKDSRKAAYLRRFAKSTGTDTLFAYNVPLSMKPQIEEAIRTNLLRDAIYDNGKSHTLTYNPMSDPSYSLGTKVSGYAAKEEGKGYKDDGWRDKFGHIQAAPLVKAKNALGKGLENIAQKTEFTKMVYDSFKLAPPKLQVEIRKMKAAQQKALEMIGNVVNNAKDITPQERILISDLVEKMVKSGVVPPEHIVRVAEKISKIINSDTDEQVRLGMLSKETADRWRGKYLPRIYNRHGDPSLDTIGKKLFKTALPMRGFNGESYKARGKEPIDVPIESVEHWERLGWEVRDPLFEKVNGELKPKKNDFFNPTNTVRMWRDFTPSEREQMGEMRDGIFRFAMGHIAAQNNIALGNLFNSIAKNSEWVRPRSETGYTKIPDSEIADTGGVKRYGNLAGLYIRDDIFSHLSNFEESSELLKIYRQGMGQWKMGKTVLNPVSHTNNVISNITMAHFAGVSYWDAHKYIGAIKDFTKDAPMLQEAKDIGLLTGDITRTEIISQMPDEIRAMMNMQESQIKKWSKAAYNAFTLFLSKPMSNAYRFEDDFFKYVIYRDARQHGLSPEDAMLYATQYIFNYDDLPKGARIVRDSPVGIPFFSYIYKAVPALIHTATHYPWRFAAPSIVVGGYAKAVYMALALLYGLISEDDDLEDKLKAASKLREQDQKSLPPWNQGQSAFMTDKTIRLGANDELTGLPLFADVSRFLPGGDIFDISNGENTTLPAPFMPSNPILTTIIAMLFNKDTFTSKDITDKNDTAEEAAKKRAGWLLKTLSPAISPTGYHADRLMNALAHETNQTIKTPFKDYTGFGKDGLPVQAKYAVPQTFGIKVRPVDLEKNKEMAAGQDKSEINSIKSEMRQAQRLLDNHAISQREYDHIYNEGEKKIDRISNQM